VPYRVGLHGILYRLRTGCQWKALSAAFGSGSTCHRRFQEWVAAHLFEKLWRVLLRWYDRRVGMAWAWQILDSATVAAPLGGGKTGKNPTDRGKLGTKRHILADRRGIPLAATLSAANAVDKAAALPTVRTRLVKPSAHSHPAASRLNHFAADKAYDDAGLRRGLRRFGYLLHIGHKRQRGEPEVPARIIGRRHPARRWVVERTNSWHNRFRALKLRWEKKPETYLGLVQFASALIIFRFLG
jgi:putative transposase